MLHQCLNVQVQAHCDLLKNNDGRVIPKYGMKVANYLCATKALLINIT